MKRILATAALTLALPCLALGQVAGQAASPSREQASSPTQASTMPTHGVFTPGDITWVSAPASIPAGAKIAVLEGDPAKPGPFTMRIQMPDRYRIPPHWHPQVEHVTVISGTFNLGMGDKFDEKAGRAMPAGTFGFLPPQMRHYAWATGETVVQVHGMGPWEIIYVIPTDDPDQNSGSETRPTT